METVLNIFFGLGIGIFALLCTGSILFLFYRLILPWRENWPVAVVVVMFFWFFAGTIYFQEFSR